MELLPSVGIFIGSIVLLLWAGTFVVGSLVRIAMLLRWREFVIALVIPALAGTAPNLFFGIFSIINKHPELSFSDVVGGNVVDLTLTIALAALIAKGLPAGSRLVQGSALFTIAIAVLPLILILDNGRMGRIDGLLLIASFFVYIAWVFSKRERFSKSDENKNSPIQAKAFLRDFAKVILGILILIIAAEGMVRSTMFFAQDFKIPLVVMGILVAGFGNCFPEIYFATLCARKGKNWMILGDVMGAIIAPATLVLGIVAFISPFQINDLSPFAIARIFLILSALFFLLCVRTGQKITRKEAIFLLFVYIAFVACEIIL